MEKTEKERYSKYLNNKIITLKKDLLKFPKLLDLNLLVNDLEKDLDGSDAQIQEIVNAFLDYIGHIKLLSESIDEYSNENNEFTYKPKRAKELIKLLKILQELIPLKKLVYDGIKKRKTEGESVKNIQIFINKFKEGHGIHDLDEAKQYWNIDNFFSKKISKIEVFKEKIKTKISIFLSIFIGELKGIKDLLISDF